MKKTALYISFFTLLSQIIGFFRDIILSYYFGASQVTDAYIIALTFPGIIFTFIGTGIATNFIPMYTKIAGEEGTERADRFTNNMTAAIMIALSAIVLLCMVFTAPLVRLLALGFDESTLRLAVLYTRISLLGIFISVMIHVFSGYLQIKGRFFAPAVMGIPFHIVAILSIIAARIWGDVFLPAGIVAALVIQAAFLLYFVNKAGFRFKAVLNLKDKHLRNLLFLSVPVIISVSVNEVNVIVDKTIASGISVGGISALKYSGHLTVFINTLFVMPLVTVLYPKISELAVSLRTDDLKKHVAECVTLINLIVIPATFGLILFSEPIIRLLYGRGAFGVESIALTSGALAFYSVGMAGIAYREILSRVFYSYQDTKTPMINSGISVLLNIALILILSPFMGINGLALATSISAIVCAVLLHLNLRKKIGSFGFTRICISLLKTLAASVIMTGTSYISYKYLTGYLRGNVSLITAISIGIFVYALLIYVLKFKEIEPLKRAVISKLFSK